LAAHSSLDIELAKQPLLPDSECSPHDERTPAMAMPLERHGDGVQPLRPQRGENLLLAAAPGRAALAPFLERFDLPQEAPLYDADAVITHFIFPVKGITSLVMDMDGGTVEVGAIGPEGMIGIPALLGVPTTTLRIFTQSACTLDRIAVEDLDRVMTADPKLRALLLRYAEAYLDEVSQSVACNRLHTLEERCARWLLMTHDRTGADEMKLKQRFLSYMLGVHRPAVSLAAGALQKAGIIRYSRGTIRILDRAALEAAACGCYERGRRAFARARLAGPGHPEGRATGTDGGGAGQTYVLNRTDFVS
jgi:CRP-like cAMP-binding protein